MLNAHACLAFFRNGDYFLSLHSQLTSACKIRALRNLFVSVGTPERGKLIIFCWVRVKILLPKPKNQVSASDGRK